MKLKLYPCRSERLVAPPSLATQTQHVSNRDHVTFSLQLLRILHPLNGLFSRTTWVGLIRYQKSKTSLDLNEARDDGVWGWQWHQLDHMQTICTSLQTDNHTNTLPLNFYRPGALPAAQPTVPKHWRQYLTFWLMLKYFRHSTLYLCIDLRLRNGAHERFWENLIAEECPRR